MTIIGTPGTPGSADSFAKRILDLLEANLEGRASKSQQSQMISGVQVQHIDPEKLESMRNRFAAKYRSEQIRAGNITSNSKIKTRFVSS